jgi:hypothetical protein
VVQPLTMGTERRIKRCSLLAAGNQALHTIAQSNLGADHVVEDLSTDDAVSRTWKSTKGFGSRLHLRACPRAHSLTRFLCSLLAHL